MRVKLFLAIGILSLLLVSCAGVQTATTEVWPAPDFDLPNALGGDVSLSDYAGQPVFLFFHMAVG